jgi:hypothetical protein
LIECLVDDGEPPLAGAELHQLVVSLGLPASRLSAPAQPRWQTTSVGDRWSSAGVGRGLTSE